MMLVINMTTGTVHDPDEFVVIDHLSLTEKEQDIVGLGLDQDGVWEIGAQHGKPITWEKK
jgi:hypothetical protein